MNNVVAFCALAVAVVAAYNFDDPEFNRILADDFDDLSNDYTTIAHPRSRRDEDAAKDEKCHHRKKWGELCCAEDIVRIVRDGNKDLKKECFKSIVGKDKPEKFDPFNCESMEQRKNQVICVIECVSQKMNLLDSDGNPKEAEFNTFVKDTFSTESWLASMQDKIISTCLEEGRNATANRDAADSPSSCNPAAAKMAHCLFREIQLNCPAEKIADEKSCARFQERIKRRDFFQPPPPSPAGVIEEPEN